MRRDFHFGPKHPRCAEYCNKDACSIPFLGQVMYTVVGLRYLLLDIAIRRLSYYKDFYLWGWVDITRGGWAVQLIPKVTKALASLSIAGLFSIEISSASKYWRTIQFSPQQSLYLQLTPSWHDILQTRPPIPFVWPQCCCFTMSIVRCQQWQHFC